MSLRPSTVLLLYVLVICVSSQNMASPPGYFSSRLNIVSPANDGVYSKPVVPITIKLETLDERTLDADKEHDMIHFSLKTEAEGGYEESLDEDLLMYLLPSVSLRLCFHVKHEPLYYCARDFVSSSETTGGSLFRMPPGPHTIYTWLMTVSEEDEGGEYVYSNSCSYEDMESLLCDPFFVTEVGTVQAYTSSTFFVKGESGEEGEEGGGIPALARTSKSPGMRTFTREDRMKYFDKVYEAEIWR